MACRADRVCIPGENAHNRPLSGSTESRTMFISRQQAGAAAKALADYYSAIPGKPEAKRNAIPTATLRDGGAAAHLAVTEAEAARRAEIAQRVATAAENISKAKAEIAQAKLAQDAAGDDKLAALEARHRHTLWATDLVVFTASAAAAKARVDADTEALAAETTAVAAQDAAEAARAAYDAVDQAEGDRLSAVIGEQEAVLVEVRKKYQTDYQTVRAAKMLLDAEAV